MPEKLKMQSGDIVQDNIEKVGALFPNCITEVVEDGITKPAIDFELLKQELSKDIADSTQERYQFTWPEKTKSRILANTPVKMALRPCREDSVDFDTTKNLYIEGDNLDVLKVLRETYLGKVKMIYIDPPYNTGNDFVYDDDYSIDAAEYNSICGDYDDELNKLRVNLSSDGRFHTNWLNMIYPRLKVAREFLTDDGVIFISIDENEVNTLKTICDEIFGACNFIAELIWSGGRKNDSKYISVSHEYILCYFKNYMYIRDNKIMWRERKQGLDEIYSEFERLKTLNGKDYKNIETELKKWYKSLPEGHPAKDHAHYNRVDQRGIYFADNISWPGGGGPKYELLHPITNKPVKIPSRGWLTNEITMKEWIDQGRVEFGDDESYVPTLKSYLRNREYSVPYSVINKDGRAASKRLASLMGDKVFENPKDEEVIERIIEFIGAADDDIIMDFFSGSSTTAHSVFLSNINQKANRRFILVQIPEIIDPSKASSEKAKKVAVNAVALLDSLNVPHNICELGKERIRRAGKLVTSDVQSKLPGFETKVDVGFRVFKLDDTNMKDVYYSPSQTPKITLDGFVDNIKSDRTHEDLLFQIMLDLNIELSAPVEKLNIAGKEVFSVDNGYLMACFMNNISNEVVTEIAKRHPYHFVTRDNSMVNDSVATNFDQIFKAYSPDTIRSIL